MTNVASVLDKDPQPIQIDFQDLALDFCELLVGKREQALGFELYGKDREQMIDVQASELACAASINSEIDIEWMIYELAHDLRDYLYFLRDDQLLEEEGGEPEDDDESDVELWV